METRKLVGIGAAVLAVLLLVGAAASVAQVNQNAMAGSEATTGDMLTVGGLSLSGLAALITSVIAFVRRVIPSDGGTGSGNLIAWLGAIQTLLITAGKGVPKRVLFVFDEVGPDGTTSEVTMEIVVGSLFPIVPKTAIVNEKKGASK